MSQPVRVIVWTDDACAWCGKPARVRGDGREYQYTYPTIHPTAVVCSPRCAGGVAKDGAARPDTAFTL